MEETRAGPVYQEASDSENEYKEYDVVINPIRPQPEVPVPDSVQNPGKISEEIISKRKKSTFIAISVFNNM